MRLVSPRQLRPLAAEDRARQIPDGAGARFYAPHVSAGSWAKDNYDEIKLRVPKGKKEEIQDRAAADGLSVNAWIGQAIDEKMEKENAEG